MSQEKEREAFGLGELDDLLELHKRTSEGVWSQGMTSHHTVAKREGSPDYRIAEFHHADDASFVDAAHKYMPKLIELARAALASQQAVKGEPLTDEQIDACWDGLTPSGYGKSRYDIARAIERAHGIHSRGEGEKA